MSKRWLMLAAVIGAGALGCGGRTHLTAGYGRAYTEALSRQATDPNAAKKKEPLRGLDSQEAAAISRGYRKQMEPMGTTGEESRPVLIMSSPNRAPAAEIGPSVPPGR